MRRSSTIRPMVGMLFSIVLISSGCDTAALADAPTAAVRDSAGIRIVENTGPAEGTAPRPVDPEPIVRIGALDGAEHDQLHRVRHVVRLTSGVIVVADGGTQELRFFDGNGAHIRSVGGSGGGPGEFERIAYVRALDGDSVLVYDGGNRRITILAPDGSLARDYVPQRSEGAPASVQAALADGTLLVRLPGTRSASLHPEQAMRDTLRLAALAEGGLETRLDAYAGTETVQSASSPSPGVFRTMSRTLPYTRAAFGTAAGDRIIAGSNETWEVHVYDADGRLTTITRSSHIPVRAIDDAALAEYAQVVADQQNATRISSSGSAPAAQREIQLTPHASHVPAWAALLGNETGGVWVRRYHLGGAPAPSLWDVISPDGVFRHTLELPAGFSPLYLDDEVVLGTIRDDLGVEYVHGYGLGSG